MSRSSESSPATQADVDSGKAVFWIPDARSQVYDLGYFLPAEATAKTTIEFGEGESIPEGATMTVVQAEIVDGADVLLGFTYGDTRGVCALDQVEFSKE
jgi:hypothetical protein